MKRFLCALLCGVLALSLVACSSTDSSTGSSEPSSSSEVSASGESSEGSGETSEALNESSAEPGESSENVEATGEYYFRDNVVETEDLTIKITDYKVIPVGEAGNEYGDAPVFAIWYDTTNKSGKEGITPLVAWMAVFTAVQDNDPDMVNTLTTGLTPDDAALETQMAEIKKGGTVSSAVAYVLDDESTPVTLTATKGVLGEELGSQEYPIA